MDERRIDIHFHGDRGSEAVVRKLDQVLTELKKLTHEEAHMSKELDDLTAEVARVKTVDDSIIALVNGLAAQITAAGTDPAKLAALTASLKQNDDNIAAAVTASTPPTVPFV